MPAQQQAAATDDAARPVLPTSTGARTGFTRTPSGVAQGTRVTYDELGKLGLHKALDEYYKLSASQRNMGLCGGKGGSPPACLCRLLSRLLAPQLPAALAPPALAGALGALLYAAAWLLHASAPLTLPLALWLLFAADGRPALAPGPLAAAAALHPVAGSGAARLQAAAAALPRVSRPAAAALLALLLLALRAAEGALLRRRQRRVEASARAVTAAQVQARYAGWRLPGADDGAAAATDAGAAAARQLAAELRAEVEGAWRSVFDSPPPPELTGCPQGISQAVAKLCSETGVEAPPTAGGAAGVAACQLAAVRRVKAELGIA